jgi:hypothetical protein
MIKAHEAKYLANRVNRVREPLKAILKQIEQAALSGLLEIIGIPVCDAYAIEQELEKLGYKCSISSRQVSPNDSDYFITVSWEG